MMYNGLKVLFLSSDTGGGHRASAESLAKQFQLQYPGTTYDLLDVMSEDGCAPYNKLVKAYKHLSNHPKQWQIVYGVSNTRAYEMIADVHLRVVCERAMRKRIKSYDPDVVVSVHPLMTNVPVVSCRKISAETGRHLPMFTVVTDLGSGHAMWFSNGVEKMFIASEQIRQLAKSRGKVPDDKLVMAGLPIRHEFAVQAEALGPDRWSEEGRAYQAEVREDLELDPSKKTVLVMGGGEGVGSLSDTVDALYAELADRGIGATIVAVCGRNETLRKELGERDWDVVLARYRNRKAGGAGDGCWSVGPLSPPSPGCLEGTVTVKLRRILSSTSMRGTTSPLLTSVPPPPPPQLSSSVESSDTESQGSAEGRNEREQRQQMDGILYSATEASACGSLGAPLAGNGPPRQRSRVEVVGLGFVTRMAEYMVAADVLVSKAGPGTIAEAAAVGLPVLLTSYLPGQEEGNVDFVANGGFGSFHSDADPAGVAEEVGQWLTDEAELRRLSEAARAVGAPNAAADIVRVIGDSTLRWKEVNDANENEAAEVISSGSASP